MAPIRGAATLGAILIFSAAPCATSEPPEAVTLDPARVVWSELDFKMHKFVVNVTLTTTLTRLSAEDAQSAWIDAPSGKALIPAGPELIRLESVSDVAGRRFDGFVWFDPVSAVAFQRVSIETKKNTHRKVFRLTEDGYYLEWRKPKDKAEIGLAPGKWSSLTETYERYPSAYKPGTPVIDGGSLFYVLSAGPLSKPGESLSLHVLSEAKINVLTFEVEGLEELDLSYEIVRDGKSTTRTLDKALRISVKASGLSPGEKPDFGHMSMSGDADYFIDPDNRVPVEMRGHIKLLGTVTTKLQRAVLD